MSLIGYTQLMKDIFSLEKTTVEHLLERLSRHKLSRIRVNSLKQLAFSKQDTVSGILRKQGENNTGGTYKTIDSFFKSLEKDNILVSKTQGNRLYWDFHEKALPLARYFDITSIDKA